MLEQQLVPEAGLCAGRGRAVLAVVGDAGDPGVFSGTSYYCLQAAKAAGLLDAGLALDTRAPVWRPRRILWNVGRLAATGRLGGYQYSERFLDALWRQDPPAPGDAVMSMFQLVPEDIARRSDELWFYVDQTLLQMFESYGLGAPRAVQADAVERERRGYQRAAGVIGHSRWAARDVVERYGVESSRVHAVVCGANLDAAAVAEWERRRSGPTPRREGALKLVFVGKDWRRKGLDRLIGALGVALRMGADIELTVIGADSGTLPGELAKAPGVTFAGFIDKRSNIRRFLDLVSRCHVGCLLSRAEAGGISLREFCRLGMPTLAPDVGGAPEYVVPEATQLIAPDADSETIAAVLHRLAVDRERFEAQQRAAWAVRGQASWDHAVRELGRIMGRPPL